MNWYIVFYLFSLADKIATVFGTLTIFFGICFAITLFVAMANGDTGDNEFWKEWRKFFFTFTITFFISISLWSFVPDRDDMLLIVAGGSVGEFITNDENAKELPHDVFVFLRKEILDATAEGSEAIKETLKIENTSDRLKKLSKEELIKMLEEK